MYNSHRPTEASAGPESQGGSRSGTRVGRPGLTSHGPSLVGIHFPVDGERRESALKRRSWRLACSAMVSLAAGCVGVTLPDLDDIIPGNGNENTNQNDNASFDVPGVTLNVYATNTGGATGIALRPSDGALFAVNPRGLFGPINEGDDLSEMDPIGATNLADPDLFDIATESFVLAITNEGEFWIGSPCCVTLAVVPPEGGDAVPFLGLAQGVSASNIKPETMTVAPSGFQGPQVKPGDLLIGQETTFSRLAVVDVAGDRTVVTLDNPLLMDMDDSNDVNRNAHHLIFGADGRLYSSRGAPGLLVEGFQSIAPDGTPTPLPGSLAVAAASFVVFSNGDMIARGTIQTGPSSNRVGLLFYSAEDEEFAVMEQFTQSSTSEDDEMVARPDDSMVFLSRPERNQIVLLVEQEE